MQQPFTAFYTFLHILGNVCATMSIAFCCSYCSATATTTIFITVVGCAAVTWLLLKHFRNVHLWHRTTSSCCLAANKTHGECCSCNWLYKYCRHFLKGEQEKKFSCTFPVVVVFFFVDTNNIYMNCFTPTIVSNGVKHFHIQNFTEYAFSRVCAENKIRKCIWWRISWYSFQMFLSMCLMFVWE